MLAKTLYAFGTEHQLNSWEQVERAIGWLNWDEPSHNWLQILIRPDWFFTIAGGPLEFNVYCNLPDDHRTHLINPAAGDGCRIICIDDQPSRIPNRYIVDAVTMLDAAYQFALEGRLSNEFEWV